MFPTYYERAKHPLRLLFLSAFLTSISLFSYSQQNSVQPLVFTTESKPLLVKEINSSTVQALKAETSADCKPVLVTFEDTFPKDNCYQISICTRTWIARDQCGNEIQTQQIIQVLPDMESPVILSTLDTKYVDCPDEVQFEKPRVKDNVTVAAELSYEYEEYERVYKCESYKSVKRKWMISDHCNNTVIAEQTFFVHDSIPPIIEIEKEAPKNSEEIKFHTVSARDYCSQANLTFTDTQIGEDSIRTWVAMDACGNMSEMSQAVRMKDSDLEKDYRLDFNQDNLKTSGFKLKPNPAFNNITIEFDNKDAAPESIQCYNVLGALQFTIPLEKETNFSNYPINITDLQAGTYILVLNYTNNTRKISQFLKIDTSK